MLRLIIQQIRKIFKNTGQEMRDSEADSLSVDHLIQTLKNDNHQSTTTTTLNAEETKAVLDNACATITLYMREDGEFAITSSFSNTDPEVVEVSSLILHMMNSGQLVDYFLKSLKLWGKNNNNQAFTLDIIKQWKILFEQTDPDSTVVKSKLAVDPSEGFSLKHVITDK